jgi:hypothetical protein
MAVPAHSYNSPYRIWRCPACGNPSGRAGHINAECAPAKPVEYVRADTTRGAVEALHEAIRLARDFNRGAMTWREYDRKLTALEVAHPQGGR